MAAAAKRAINSRRTSRGSTIASTTSSLASRRMSMSISYSFRSRSTYAVRSASSLISAILFA